MLRQPEQQRRVSSIGAADPLLVPHTTTPRSAAAAKSIEALRMPEVISSFSFGSRASSEAVIGVRSRMMTRMSHSCRCTASSVSSVKCALMADTSTRSASADQSAILSATCW